ncbi:MAG: hypothetical protein H6650_00145 [Ardenticatenales bacterium]|nr:hypothetical protein [Ardenticatenales bacterium]
MRRTILLLTGCLLFGLWPAAAKSSAFAQTPSPPEITVISDEATVDFPQSVTFNLEIDTAHPVKAATLNFATNRHNCLPVETQAPAEINGNQLTWQWAFTRSGNPPPGARLSWSWTLTDESGGQLTTPKQMLTFTDPRYDWRQVGADGVFVNWYRGSNVGPELLQAALAGLERLQGEMGIEWGEEVQFFIYGNSDDMREAVLYVQDWAGALAFADYGVILMGVAPSQLESWGKPTVAHELAHLVVGRFGWSCVGGSRPTWLEEGLAVFAEGEPSATVRADIARGIAEDAFLPVRSLNGVFSAHTEDAGISYSQSYSLVAFLLQTYGQEAMRQYLRALADGDTYDQALQNVYGFNTDGLETAWRAAIGAPLRQIPPTPTPINPDLIPTAAPLQLVRVVPTPPAAASPPPAAEDGGSPICAAAFLPPLLFLVALSKPYGWRGRKISKPIERDAGSEGRDD